MGDTHQPKKKLYCYVDETGQDTGGAVFFVAVVVSGEDRDTLRRHLHELEERSGKRAKKWSRATSRQRIAYIQGILKHGGFGTLCFSKFENTRAYVDLTIFSVAKAINAHWSGAYTATILVDG